MTTGRRYVKGILVALCLTALTVGPPACGGGGSGPAGEPGIESLNDFLAEYGDVLDEFETHETGDVIAYFRQRMVGEAVVQGDHMLYQFHKADGRLRKQRIRWGRSVPDRLPSGLMTEAQVETLLGGGFEAAMLCYIAPDSVTMPLDPVPENPCWVACDGACGNGQCVIVDAVLGDILGTALGAPDHTAFSGTGPTQEGPCSGSWSSYRTNAATWFDLMGYSTESLYWPDQTDVESHVGSTSTSMFYEIGHSQGTHGILFTHDCIAGTYAATSASEIATWIQHYTKMPFTFLASCWAMSGLGPGTLEHAFRKGSLHDTAVVGYKQMSSDTCHGPCWLSYYAFNFQDTLFDLMSQGWTVKDAFDEAQLDYPPCVPCTHFVGDESFVVVPIVHRGWLPPRFDIVLMRIPEILDLPLPPDPFIRIHLEDALQETQAARDALDRGEPGISLLGTQQAVIHLEAAVEGGVDDAAELADTLVGGTDQYVGESIVDATFVVDAQNADLQKAREAHEQAQGLAQSGANVAAMVAFLEAWDHLQNALAAP